MVRAGWIECLSTQVFWGSLQVAGCYFSLIEIPAVSLYACVRPPHIFYLCPYGRTICCLEFCSVCRNQEIQNLGDDVGTVKEQSISDLHGARLRAILTVEQRPVRGQRQESLKWPYRGVKPRQQTHEEVLLCFQNVNITQCRKPTAKYGFVSQLGFWLLWRHIMIVATLLKENI